MTQREFGAGPRPIWLRIAALLCVMLVGVAGIAQAAHIHGELLPSSAIRVATHTALAPALAEDACPLCVAMHSALPVTLFAVLLVVAKSKNNGGLRQQTVVAAVVLWAFFLYFFFLCFSVFFIYASAPPP